MGFLKKYGIVSPAELAGYGRPSVGHHQRQVLASVERPAAPKQLFGYGAAKTGDPHFSYVLANGQPYASAVIVCEDKYELRVHAQRQLGHPRFP